MVIDSLFDGVSVVDSNPVFEYRDGEKTEHQKRDSRGFPVWKVTVALPDGVFVLPVSVKVGSLDQVQESQVIRFTGVEVNTFQGNIFFSAAGFENIDDDLMKTLEG